MLLSGGTGNNNATDVWPLPHQPPKRFRQLDVALIMKRLDYFAVIMFRAGTGFNLKTVPALARAMSWVAHRKLGEKLEWSGPCILSRFRFPRFPVAQPCRWDRPGDTG